MARRRASLVLSSMMVVVMTAMAPARAGPLPGRPATCDGTWQLVPSPNVGDASFLSAVSADSATDAWAVGTWEEGTDEKTLVEHWDGSTWTVVASPSPGTQFNYLSDVVALSPTDAWAVGVRASKSLARTLVEHWDGRSWSVVPSLNVGNEENDLFGVAAISASDVWAVGQQFSARGAYLLEHWDGTGWTSFPAGYRPGDSHSLLAVAGAASNDAWAVGSSTPRGGGPTLTLAEHWDGTTWSIVPTVNPEPKHTNQLYDVTSPSASDVWTVGYYEASLTSTQTLIEHWDGTTWSRSTSVDATTDDFLLSVSADGASDAWAVGNAFDAGLSQTLIEHWDGTGWTLSTSPSRFAAGSFLEGVSARTANDVWAVGDGYAGAGLVKTIIEHLC